MPFELPSLSFYSLLMNCLTCRPMAMHDASRQKKTLQRLWYNKSIKKIFKSQHRVVINQFRFELNSSTTFEWPFTNRRMLRPLKASQFVFGFNSNSTFDLIYGSFLWNQRIQSLSYIDYDGMVSLLFHLIKWHLLDFFSIRKSHRTKITPDRI